MPDVDRLVAAIRREIDEDERTALAATERDWRPDGANSCQVYVARDDGSNRTIAWCRNGYEDDFANSLRIAHQDPARTLRRVAAHRKILDRYELADRSRAVFTDSYRDALLQVIRDLAEVYGVQDSEEGVT